MLGNKLKCLSLFSKYTICGVLDQFHWWCFIKSMAPRYAKNVKKLPIFKKEFFRLKQPKTPWNLFVTPFVQSTANFRPVFLKKVVSHFSRNLWPQICRKSQKISNFWKKFFFARNNLKCLKFFLQHHLCTPRQISGRYLSKKKLVIFQEICDPGYAKKVKKFPIFEKFFFRSKQP